MEHLDKKISNCLDYSLSYFITFKMSHHHALNAKLQFVKRVAFFLGDTWYISSISILILFGIGCFSALNSICNSSSVLSPSKIMDLPYLGCSKGNKNVLFLSVSVTNAILARIDSLTSSEAYQKQKLLWIKKEKNIVNKNIWLYFFIKLISKSLLLTSFDFDLYFSEARLSFLHKVAIGIELQKYSVNFLFSMNSPKIQDQNHSSD